MRKTSNRVLVSMSVWSNLFLTLVLLRTLAHSTVVSTRMRVSTIKERKLQRSLGVDLLSY